MKEHVENVGKIIKETEEGDRVFIPKADSYARLPSCSAFFGLLFDILIE